jgi:hypothetical protein
MLLENTEGLEYDLLHITEVPKLTPALDLPRDWMSLVLDHVAGERRAARPNAVVSDKRRWL